MLNLDSQAIGTIVGAILGAGIGGAFLIINFLLQQRGAVDQALRQEANAALRRASDFIDWVWRMLAFPTGQEIEDDKRLLIEWGEAQGDLQQLLILSPSRELRRFTERLCADVDALLREALWASNERRREQGDRALDLSASDMVVPRVKPAVARGAAKESLTDLRDWIAGSRRTRLRLKSYVRRLRVQAHRLRQLATPD